MNRLHPQFRRVTAVAAGALLGLTGVAILAAPASAHHSEVKVQAQCDTATGEWVVDWTINNYAPREVKKYKLVEVAAKTFVGETVTDVTIPGIAVTEGDTYPHATDQPLTATQRLDGKVTEASLAVRAAWDNGFQEQKPREGVIELGGTCAKDEPPAPTTPKPTAGVVTDCEGVVVVKLGNAEDATAPAKFTVTGAKNFTETVTVEPGESKSVTVPADKAATIKVVVDGIEEPLFDGEPTPAENCVEPGEPAGAYQSTCDELIFEISNPEDGETITVTFTPNKGEPKTLTVKPGESGAVSFPAEEGLTVTPSAEGLEDTEPIAWEKPEDCAPGGGGGDEPGLPVTGAATGGIIAGAAVLLAAGAVLFVMARRRKLRFTA